MNKQQLQDLHWILTTQINWRQEINDAARAFYKSKFPKTFAYFDEMKFYSDISQASSKYELLMQAIKTDFGIKRVAEIMANPIHKNLKMNK